MKLAPFRLGVQLAVFFMMFAIPVLNAYELYFVTGTYYALNVGGLGVADPVVILQAMFASGQLTVPLLSAVIFPILVALVFGRVWCGWCCPYLFVADRIESLRRWCKQTFFKEPGLPSSMGSQNSLQANLIRFLFLFGGTALGGILGIPVLNYFSAPGIMSTEAMIFIKEHWFSVEVFFLFALLTVQLTVWPRFWCRFFCPTGTTLSLIRSPYTLRVESTGRDTSSPCCKENSCSDVCPMKLRPYMESGDLLCVNCGKCVDACKLSRLKFAGIGSVPKLKRHDAMIK